MGQTTLFLLVTFQQDTVNTYIYIHKMKEVVAFMLARMGGNENPSKEDVSAILAAVGIKAEADKLDALFSDLGKLDCTVDEAINKGMDKLAVIPCANGNGQSNADNEQENSQKAKDEKAADDADSNDDESSPNVGGGGLFDNNSDSDSDSDSDDDDESDKE